MTLSTCFFLLLLSLYVATGARVHPVVHPGAQPPAAGGGGTASPDIVAKACEQSPDKPLCISILKAQSSSSGGVGVNDMEQATMVSIQAAMVEATATSDLIKLARRREENKEVVEDGIEEETLADCCTTYSSLIEKLTGATGLLAKGPGVTVLSDLKDAFETAETCEMSIAGGKKSPMVEEVARKNDYVKKLCSNALSVYDAYAKEE